jgi:hypothetical protein
MTAPRYVVCEIYEDGAFVPRSAVLPDAEQIHLTIKNGTVTAVPMIEIDTRQAYGCTQYADGSVKYIYGDLVHPSCDGCWEPAGYEVALWVDATEENR